ncbi:hypothetical protein B0H10DRAFT_1954804 [Mycena sp. CBHHK59/15]|nr:hypothetical protein B0H10DRAFT_1954804 [Mycena sp. CBHHK59/15]
MYLSLDHFDSGSKSCGGPTNNIPLGWILQNQWKKWLGDFLGGLSGLLGKKKYFLDVTVWSQATKHIVTVTWGGLGNATTPIVTVMVASVQDKKVKKDVPDHKCFVMLLMT